MSLDTLRQNCIRVFGERAEAATTAAINMQPASFGSTDAYAMLQVDKLSEARAYLMAQKIMTEEFKKLTQPDDAKNDAAPVKQQTKTVY